MALTIKEAMRKWGPEYLTICGLVKYFPTMNYNSHVFFVNGTDGVGDDGVNTGGQVPDEPFLTITHALSKCTDGANDYVFILDYPSTAPATEVFPLLMDKQRIHVIGLQNGLLPRFKICVPSTKTSDDFAAFSFCLNAANQTYGAYCELANLIAGVKWTSSTRGIIEVNQGGLFGNHIHHCHFGLMERSNTGGKYGICIGATADGDGAGELMHSLIEYCRFGNLVTSDGIYVPATPKGGPNAVKGLIIRDNFFRVSGIGINVDLVAADFEDGGIIDNRIVMSSDAAGKAIDLIAGVTGGVIDGNRCSCEGLTDACTAACIKTGTACGPGWGRNYAGELQIPWPQL